MKKEFALLLAAILMLTGCGSSSASATASASAEAAKETEIETQAEEASPDADVLKGLAVRGSDAQNKQEEVRESVGSWLSELGF